jgi:hypothetical protein
VDNTYAFGITTQGRYLFRWKIIDAKDLIVSNDPFTFAVNPKYPQSFQPRSRDRAAYQLQVENIASNLDPDKLITETHMIDTGSPIIGDQDKIVECGNGRIIAMMIAAKEYPAKIAAYKKRLKEVAPSYGLPAASIDKMSVPVLVRARMEPMTPEQRQNFAQECNGRATAVSSSVERAKSYAALITPAMLNGLIVLENETIFQAIKAVRNKDFVIAFLNKVPANDRGEFVDAKGEISQDGTRLIATAIFVSFFKGERGLAIASKFFDSNDPDILTVFSGITRSLTILAQAESLVTSGARQPDYTFSEDLAKVVEVYSNIKATPQMSVEKYLNQQAFERQLNPFQEKVLQTIGENARSGKRIGQILSAFGQAIIDSTPPNQTGFMMVEPLTKSELWDAVVKMATMVTVEDIAALFDYYPSEVEKKLNEAIVTAPGVSKTDINFRVAADAYRGTSWEPEDRAYRQQLDYVNHMNAVYADLAKGLTTPEDKELLDSEFQRYRAGYLQHQMGWLGAHSRVISSFITGGSNFPVRRNEKANDALDKRTQEWMEWDTRAQKAIHSKLYPLEHGISSDRADAPDLLKQKLAQLEKTHSLMVDANKVIRNKNLSEDEKVKQLGDLGLKETIARELFKPDFMGRIGFADYQLSNSSANMKRIRERIASLEKRQGQETSQYDFEGGTVIDSVEDNRIQIQYDGKPAAEIIKKLKSHGFHWTPSLGVWQRMRGSSAEWAVKDITGVLVSHTKKPETEAIVEPEPEIEVIATPIPEKVDETAPTSTALMIKTPEIKPEYPQITGNNRNIPEPVSYLEPERLPIPEVPLEPGQQIRLFDKKTITKHDIAELFAPRPVPKEQIGFDASLLNSFVSNPNLSDSIQQYVLETPDPDIDQITEEQIEQGYLSDVDPIAEIVAQLLDNDYTYLARKLSGCNLSERDQIQVFGWRPLRNFLSWAMSRKEPVQVCAAGMTHGVYQITLLGLSNHGERIADVTARAKSVPGLKPIYSQDNNTVYEIVVPEETEKTLEWQPQEVSHKAARREPVEQAAMFESDQVKANLKRSIHDELKAIKDYEDRGTGADEKTAELYKEIRRDELTHYDAFTKRLAKLQGTALNDNSMYRSDPVNGELSSVDIPLTCGTQPVEPHIKEAINHAEEV